MNFLRLIRFKNLLLIIFVQGLMTGALVVPLLDSYGLNNDVPFLSLLALCISTLLLAAGGYSCNDVADNETDRINKPQRVLPQNLYSLQQAKQFSIVLSVAGVLTGIALAIHLKSLVLGLLFPGVAALLLLYSGFLKRTPLIGNILVAALAALTILSVNWVTVAHLKEVYDGLIFETNIPGELNSIINFFALFAFLINLIRELIKDAEDVEGDTCTGCRTLPVVAGLGKTRILLLTMILITLVAINLFFFNDLHQNHWTGGVYLLFFIMVPLTWLGYIILKAKNKNDFSRASFLSKAIMISGTAYALVWMLQFKLLYQ